jgi:YvrJ protein family
MDEYLKAVSTVGFPIVMTIYLLVRFEAHMGAELKALRDAISKLINVLARKGLDIDD